MASFILRQQRTADHCGAYLLRQRLDDILESDVRRQLGAYGAVAQLLSKLRALAVGHLRERSNFRSSRLGDEPGQGGVRGRRSAKANLGHSHTCKIAANASEFLANSN